jgi:Protein of unknown function (DUF3631)
MLAIADLIGGEWPQTARAAALTLSAEGGEPDDQSRGVMPLMDIERVFKDRQKSGGRDLDRISSTELAIKLEAMVDRPWATWSRGKPITPAAVARMLRTFGVGPNTIKLADGSQPNGFKQNQFADAFARYLPHSPSSPAGSSPSSPSPAIPGPSAPYQRSPLWAGGEDVKPAQSIEKQRTGEDGEPLETSVQRSEDGDKAGLPLEPLRLVTARARDLTADVLAWTD